ncbi:Modification methylase HindIII [Mycobacteroides abscessus subsp. massiliense]|nr:Modification methylase HindIII [Mycobacteroides abscessus subsp. massiliense]
MDVSKAIDKAAGVGQAKRTGKESGTYGAFTGNNTITAPVTADAKQWQGWGTALKPAFEPIVVARKPLAGTVAANVLEHGTGALNINACRIHTAGSEARSYTVKRLKPGAELNRTGGNWRPADGVEYEGTTTDGRWPTNVVLDAHQAEVLDQQSGLLKSGARTGKRSSGTCEAPREASQGGASRFFPVFRYEAKAPTSERPSADGVQHPTVKPLDLMRWLVRLVTPVGAVVLEPFAGSGTTAEACILEDRRCIAIEREAEYLPLIVSRLRKPVQQGLFGLGAGA